MKWNVAYLRVSTEAQTEKYGLDMQKQKILDFCGKKGVVIDKWYVDGGYSGSKLERPKVQELLNDVENNKISIVYVYKLDRMSRDVIDTLNLLYKVLPSHGVELISATEEIRTENPMDKVMVTMNAAMNQYEREVIRMRMSAGMVERVKKGLWMGGGRIPFGYYYDRNDGILHPKEEEAELVRNAYKLYIEGYSCDNISKMLGFKGERIVMQILKRKSNIGMIEYKGEIYKGRHEPIIDEKTFYQAQECMEKRHTNSHINNNNMLTGLCYCGICGAKMRYQKWGKYHKICCYSQYKSGKDYMIRNPNCENKRVFAYEAEKEVEDSFKRFIINVEEKEEGESDTSILEASIKKANAKIKKLYNLYVDNPTENLMEVIIEEEERVKDLKKQFESKKAKEHKGRSVQIEKIKRVADVWDDFTTQEKNKILKQCIEKIIITKDVLEIRFVSF